MFAASARSMRKRSGSYCVRAWVHSAACSGGSCASRAPGRRPGDRMEGRNQESEDGRTDRERPVPHRALEARQADHAPPQSSVLGPALGVPRPARHSFPGRRGGPCRGLSDGRVRGRCRFCAELRPGPPARARHRDSRLPGAAWDHFEIRMGPGGILRSGTSWFVAHLLSASIDVASRKLHTRALARKDGSATASSFRLGVGTTARIGAPIATVRPRRAACSSWRVACAARMACTSAEETGCRCASSPGPIRGAIDRT